MSAIVCGKRSNFFEDLQSPSSSSSPPPVSSKRIRCSSSSSSPVRFSPPRSAAAASVGGGGGAGTGASFHHFSCNHNTNLSPGGASLNSSALDHLIRLFPDMDKKVCSFISFAYFFSLMKFCIFIFLCRKDIFLFTCDVLYLCRLSLVTNYYDSYVYLCSIVLLIQV